MAFPSKVFSFIHVLIRKINISFLQCVLSGLLCVSCLFSFFSAYGFNCCVLRGELEEQKLKDLFTITETDFGVLCEVWQLAG